ncbi:hypothetical protein F4808DRAFT_464618 [Astrocystis sublimbata]|nr:hypothetical protein F4808DRAFT_464618 [Astrocystis sublimbata]
MAVDWSADISPHLQSPPRWPIHTGSSAIRNLLRIAPNELSFKSAQSWNDKYGFRQGHQTSTKSEFCDGGSFAVWGVYSIISGRDPTIPEETFTKTVDRVLQIIGKQGCKSAGATVDIGKA